MPSFTVTVQDKNDISIIQNYDYCACLMSCIEGLLYFAYKYILLV